MELGFFLRFAVQLAQLLASSMQEPRSSSAGGVAALSGTVAGRFVISKLLGAGGMGQVYQAQDTKLKRVVAIKRMAPRLQQNEQDRRRFLREAQQASALNHPNIASIYDVIEEQGEIFLSALHLTAFHWRQF